MTNNSFYELLHAFLDGDLPAHQTELFFRELARSPERQKLFSDHIKLQNSLRYGLASEPAMPDDAFSAIAGKIGLSAPDPVVSSVKRPAFSWRMLRNPAIAASLSVLMLILFLLPGASWLFPEMENTTTPQAAQRSTPVATNIQQSTSKHSVPLQKLSASIVQSETSAEAIGQGRRRTIRFAEPTDSQSAYVQNDITVNKTTENVDKMTKSVNISTNTFIQASGQQPIQPRYQAQITFAPMANRVLSPATIPAERLFGGKIELGIRGTGFAARSYPSPEITPLTDPPLNNIAFSVQYNISSEHSISLEAGQESFRQEFYRLEGNDSLAYKQHLLDGWGAIGYRYSPDELALSTSIRPFAKLSLGATSVGALTRVGIGISADLTPQLSCQIQAEGTGLWYSVDGVLFSTRQVGLSYGFSYRL